MVGPSRTLGWLVMLGAIAAATDGYLSVGSAPWAGCAFGFLARPPRALWCDEERRAGGGQCTVGRAAFCVAAGPGRFAVRPLAFRPQSAVACRPALTVVCGGRKLKDTDTQLLHQDGPRHAVLPEKQERRRTIIVGDVHGCYDELRALLSKANFQPREDTLVLAGDFVNKGPKSAAVVRYAREVGAWAVVGNHELLSLRALATSQSSKRSGVANSLAESKYAWTSELSAADVDYLRNLPFTLRLPLHGALIVHAGLVPGQPLESQDLLSLVTTRSLVAPPADASPDASSPRPHRGARRWVGTRDTKRGVPWAARWKGPEHVYFGHSTRRGVQQRAFATGLDTGCVYGGVLSAAVLAPATAAGIAAAGESDAGPAGTGAVGGRSCAECGATLVAVVCTNKYKCKLGRCSNKYPCKRRDLRCPSATCTSAAQAPVAAERHAILSVPALCVYDDNFPWRHHLKPRRADLADADGASQQQAAAAAAAARGLLPRGAAGGAAGAGDVNRAAELAKLRRREPGVVRGGAAGAAQQASRAVPKAVRAKVRALLERDGPLVQSSFVPRWDAEYPDTPFNVSAWGFRRLSAALKAMPGTCQWRLYHSE